MLEPLDPHLDREPKTMICFITIEILDKIRKLFVFAPLLFCSYCASNLPHKSPVNTRTILPDDEVNRIHSLNFLPDDLTLDPSLISVRRISRKFAEIRQGPGHDYPILDKHLKKELRLLRSTISRTGLKLSNRNLK